MKGSRRWIVVENRAPDIYLVLAWGVSLTEAAKIIEFSRCPAWVVDEKGLEALKRWADQDGAVIGDYE